MFQEICPSYHSVNGEGNQEQVATVTAATARITMAQCLCCMLLLCAVGAKTGHIHCQMGVEYMWALKCLIQLGDLGSHLVCGSLDTCKSAPPNGISFRSAIFWAHDCAQVTDRPRHIGMNSSHLALCAAMWVKNYQHPFYIDQWTPEGSGWFSDTNTLHIHT